MRMLISGVLVSFVLASGNVQGVEGCCVEPDIAAAFLRNSYLSRDFPPDFPNIPDVPDGFELIGSHQWFNRRQVTVAWRTDISTESARNAIGQLLENAGWQVLTPRTQLSHGGFVGQRQRRIQDFQSFCSDEHGQLNLDVWESTVGTTVSLLQYKQNNRATSCEDTIHNFQRSSLKEYLPTLQLPPEFTSDQSGSSSGRDEAHAEATVVTDVRADEFLAHFDPQMRDQGWTYDTAFSGLEVSGSIWRSVIDNRTLICMLKVIDRGDSVKMKMTVDRI